MTTKRIQNDHFVIIACSCCSVARSVRYVCTYCPLQNQPVARLPCCFCAQAPFAKTMVCIALANLSTSYVICCFLCAFHAFCTLFFHFFVIFSENQFPAIAGEYDFENRINAKSRQKELLRPSIRITSIVKLFMAPGLSKSVGTFVFLIYGPSLEAPFAMMESTACILDDVFTALPCCCSHFVEMQPAPGS